AVSSALIVLVIAAFALRLPIDPAHVNYGLLALSCALAFVAVVALASAFALFLLAGRDAYGYGELAAQALYIVSGAIFPISVLPGAIATIAAFSPIVYWLELVRRSLLGSNAVLMFPGLTDGEVLLRLIAGTLGLLVLATFAFRVADRMARSRGLIDMEGTD
ncbi:MAG TPA: ABC transporter permease, partial [Solirubrobacterales bacterium]|nr:ABC transporter permease [Solirubrobacterales bacterium]